jgi:hypothetical protein
MHRFLPAVLLLAIAGCGAPKTRDEQLQEVFEKESTPSGPSAAADVEQLEHWSGKTISLVGRLFMEGDDWFKYVGQKVWCRGILHTYTKNIEGYRGPSLELNDFEGP